MSRLQNQPLLWLALKRDSQFQQLANRGRKLGEEDVHVFGISLDVLLELWVFDQSHICRQHHEGLGRVLVLLRAVPASPAPLLVQEEAEKVICQNGRGKGPWAVKTGVVTMTVEPD